MTEGLTLSLSSGLRDRLESQGQQRGLLRTDKLSGVFCWFLSAREGGNEGRSQPLEVRAPAEGVARFSGWMLFRAQPSRVRSGFLGASVTHSSPPPVRGCPAA